MANLSSRPIDFDLLKFDPRNPRITEYFSNSASKSDILKVLIERFAVDELIASILETGFWQQEPFIVLAESNKFLVLEGNRRLAAITVLRNPNLRNEYGLSNVDATKLQQALDSTNQISCIIVESRYSSWQLIGFKHINGPQRWNSFAKAAYIHDLRNEGFSVDDIADQLGDKNRTVIRLLRAYTILKQAESSHRWNRTNREKTRFAFSHLMTGLEYKEISDFIELPVDESDEGAKQAKNEERLLELMVWLYGDKRSETPAIVQSQNPDLSNLRRALSSQDGIRELQRTRRLDYAVEASRGDYELLLEALSGAESNIEKCIGKMVKGFRLDSDILQRCRTIQELSESLLAAARRRRDALQDD